MTASGRRPFEIAIVGGGLTGVTLAIALHRRSIPCTVYEQAASFGEIGAGVGISPNAVQALRIAEPKMAEAFERVKTGNAWPSKQEVWFDYIDGYSTTPAPDLRPLFTVNSRRADHGGAHRARFLEELVKLLPPDAAEFDKHLESINELPGERLRLKFSDGSSAEADAVIGCDGVKSRTREIMIGEGHPSAKCSYSHKYAYRGLIPRKDAIDILGGEKAENSCMWVGQDRHVLTFPVDHGNVVNLVAFVTDPNPWPSDVRLILPATIDDALTDFHDFGPNIHNLIKTIKQKPDRWGLFDLGDNPLPTYCRGRICVAGDAAHASTPHHGAGAGFGMEDVAVLSSLLAEDDIQSPDDLAAVFRAFDAVRRERSQWLVQSSRRAADLYELRNPEIGRDWQGILSDIKERQDMVWDWDGPGTIEQGKAQLRTILKAA